MGRFCRCFLYLFFSPLADTYVSAAPRLLPLLQLLRSRLRPYCGSGRAPTTVLATAPTAAYATSPPAADSVQSLRPPLPLSLSLRRLPCVYMYICRVNCATPDATSRFKLPAPVAHILYYVCFVLGLAATGMKMPIGAGGFTNVRNIWIDSVASL